MEVHLETMMERLNSGEEKIIFRIILCFVTIGLTKSGRTAWQEDEDKRKDFNIILILQEKFFTSELSKVLIDPSLQDNVIIPDGFLKYIYHVGCAINLCSIINSRLIPRGQNLSKRQRVFFLPVDRMDKEHKGS